MHWDEYYDKTNDWAVSTAISKISSLEDMGTPDEIVDVLNIIGFEDKKGATRLLNRALQQDIKFSGENLVEIADLCTKEGFQKALEQSASTLSTKDLEDMYGCVDDALLIDIIKKYKVMAPEDLAEEYEEELGQNDKAPISWHRFYGKFYDWEPEYAITRAQALTDFGTVDEVVEVMQHLFQNNEPGADQLITKALTMGVEFNEESLEDLYGIASDEMLRRIAEEQKILPPEDLREEDDNAEDLSDQIASAIYAADYALGCLMEAQGALKDGSNASVADMMTRGFLTSLWKHATLSEADVYIQQAQDALGQLNAELGKFAGNKQIRLEHGRLATAIDLWTRDGLWDTFTHMQIHKTQKKIDKAIMQVENIRCVLKEEWDAAQSGGGVQGEYI